MQAVESSITLTVTFNVTLQPNASVCVCVRFGCVVCAPDPGLFGLLLVAIERLSHFELVTLGTIGRYTVDAKLLAPL